MSVGDPKCAAHGGLLPCGECLRLSGQSFAGNPTPDKMLGSPDLREAAPAQEFVSDALALIRRALAMRDYGDKPVLWEQVWKDIEDAAQRLGNALAVGSERAMDGVGAPLVPAASEYPCSVCGGRLLPYGKAYICGGRGTELAEAQGLRERLADLEIALGFYPNISRTVSKAYDEVREALGGSAHAIPTDEPPYRCKDCGEPMGSVAKPCIKCGGSAQPTSAWEEHFRGSAHAAAPALGDVIIEI